MGDPLWEQGVGGSNPLAPTTFTAIDKNMVAGSGSGFSKYPHHRPAV